MREIVKSPLFLWAMTLLLGLAIAQLALPDAIQSTQENRPLRQMEPPSLTGVTSGRWMQNMETYVADQFPLRDQWMYLQAIWDAALMRNERGGILLGQEGWLFERCTNLNPHTAEDNVHALDTLASATDLPVSLMLVPLSSAVYANELPTWVTPDNQQALIDALYEQAPHLQTIDVCKPLRAHAIFESLTGGETLFYHTDHHWTYDGAMVGYDAWLDAMDLPRAEGIAPPSVVGGFRGTYFSRAPSPLIKAEVFAYDDPEDIVLLLNDGFDTSGTEMASLHDRAAIESPDVRDKYAQLLHGNRGHITLLNEASDGGTLLVLKDSYASAMLTLLARHYRRIEAVDLRYYAGSLPDLLEETEAESILCIYGLTTILSDRSLPLHSVSWGG